MTWQSPSCVWLGLLQGPLQAVSPGTAPISGHSSSLEPGSHGVCRGLVGPPACAQCKWCARHKSTKVRTAQALSTALGEGIQRTNKVGWGLYSLAPPFPPPGSFLSGPQARRFLRAGIRTSLSLFPASTPQASLHSEGRKAASCLRPGDRMWGPSQRSYQLSLSLCWRPVPPLTLSLSTSPCT